MLNYLGIVERIQKIIKDYNLNASSFAERIGVQRSSISHIISKRNKPSLELLSKICDAFPEIPIEWLINGQKVFKETNEADIQQQIEFPKNNLYNEETKASHPEAINTEIKPKNLIEIVYVYDDDTFKVLTK